MMSMRIHILILILTISLCGCIENDIPYPRIQGDFLTFSVQDEIKPALIDNSKRSVTVFLAEKTDIYDISVVNYTLSEGATIVEDYLKGNINLVEPMHVTLKTYQYYDWTISAIQNVERFMTISSQVGISTIDVPGRRVVAYVPSGTDLAKVKVNSIKLEPEGASMSPNLNNKVVSFVEPQEIVVTEHGRETTWTIYVDSTDSNVSTDRVDAWTNVAWLYGIAEAGKDNGFEYRLMGDDNWIKVPDEWIYHDGGKFTGRLIHLAPNTTYVVRAYSSGEYGAEMEFTTESDIQLPDASLDEWWQDGKVWNPWSEGTSSFWDTGNKGATTLGQSNTQPTDETVTGLGKAAKLETKFVGIGSIGKLAAGNLFSGQYIKTDGTNGILNFGREFKGRPTKLKGYMKHNCTTISHTSSEFSHYKGLNDTATIYIALADWNEPLEIRTNPKNRQLFDPEAENIIAYGKLESGKSVVDYTEFEIELEYRATNRIPNYIVVVGSASKYGDYFTGGDGSILWLDNLTLEYDY